MRHGTADREAGSARARTLTPIYTAEQRRRRDASRWTLVQGLLAPLQFLVFLVSLALVLRYLATGEGMVAATVSIVIKTLVLYLIMITGSIWEKDVFGKYLFAGPFFWEDVVSMLVLALHTAYLAAVVFGAPTPRHLFADQEPETEDLNARLWDCRPEKLTVKPRIRRYKERTKPGAIVSRQEEKAKALADFLKQKEAERQLVADIMRRRQVTLSELETVDPFVRKTLLNWIGKCAAANADAALTETGHRVRLRAQAGKRAKLTSEDGVLDTPDYELQVID